MLIAIFVFNLGLGAVKGIIVGLTFHCSRLPEFLHSLDEVLILTLFQIVVEVVIRGQRVALAFGFQDPFGLVHSSLVRLLELLEEEEPSFLGKRLRHCGVETIPISDMTIGSPVRKRHSQCVLELVWGALAVFLGRVALEL